ncbi:MAG: bifunctional riboflavin kinase/FAD synthetase [Anaerolineaceae bacterium]|jgi:riboflavin kinase/FMN adenylyltransferase|nr:MAG: bifunctional riboflavin kinase/FAD synthetase [Anaerolineaceae bacterium]
MPQYHSIEEASLQNAWATIGVFDGVHRGHRAIVEKLVREARANDAPAVVVTFHPHPASVLTGREIHCLTTPDERAELFDSLGVDAVITQRFTRDLSTATAHQYMSTLKQNLGLSRLLIGYDFALGKGREGNAARLAEIGSELGYAVEIVPAVSDESGVISSTEIRKLVSTGNVIEAANLLGYRYRMGGEVIRGAGRGKKINFPTANIDYPTEKVIPANGIYACWATLGNERFMAATNVGFNPTFTPERKTPSLEAYLLDFDRDIYGEELRLEFVSRLRDELKFDSVDALIEKIHEDVAQTRKILEGEQ